MPFKLKNCFWDLLKHSFIILIVIILDIITINHVIILDDIFKIFDQINTYYVLALLVYLIINSFNVIFYPTTIKISRNGREEKFDSIIVSLIRFKSFLVDFLLISLYIINKFVFTLIFDTLYFNLYYMFCENIIFIVFISLRCIILRKTLYSRYFESEYLFANDIGNITTNTDLINSQYNIMNNSILNFDEESKIKISIKKYIDLISGNFSLQINQNRTKGLIFGNVLNSLDDHKNDEDTNKNESKSEKNEINNEYALISSPAILDQRILSGIDGTKKISNLDIIKSCSIGIVIIDDNQLY